MIKILLIADTHLGFDHPIRNSSSHIRRRGKDFFSNYQSALDEAVKQNVNFVVHGGDYFFRTLIPQRIVHLAYDQLHAFLDKGIPMLIVPGNHESSRLPASLVLEHQNLYLFSSPRTFVFSVNDSTIEFSGFPCLRKAARDDFPMVQQQLIRESEHADLKILIMHQAIEGSKVGPGNYTFRKGADVIPVNAIDEGYDAVLAGHIHRQQILWKQTITGKIPVIFPGSVERTSFAEKDEQKGYYLLTFAPKSKDKFIEHQFNPLPTRKMFDLTVDCQNLNKDNIKQYLKIKLHGLPENSIVRMTNTEADILIQIKSLLLREIAPSEMIFQYKSKFTHTIGDR